MKLHIKSISNSSYVEHKMKKYSYAFRLLFTMLDEACDPIFEDRFKNRFELNDIEYRSLLADVKSFRLREETQNEQRIGKIEEIRELLERDEDVKKERLSVHKRFKLMNKLAYTASMIGKTACFGGRELLRKLTKECNKQGELRNEDKIKALRSEYRSKRENMPFSVMGEANQKGNRFFDLTDISHGNCIYKPNKSTKIEIRFKASKTQKPTLERLKEPINRKDISVSVRLSTEFIYFSFDEEHLHGYSVDERARRAEVKEIKALGLPKDEEKEKINQVYIKYYDEQRARKLEGKDTNMYIAVDLNPDNIGYSVLEKIDNEGNYRIVDVGCFDLSWYFKKRGLKSSDPKQKYLNRKRQYELTIILKQLFAIAKYHKCSKFVIEELEFKHKEGEESNHESNRKNKNLWCRNLVQQIINRRCNEDGIELIEINPCYTSFIGNIQHPFGDSASASVEVGRRGMFKYTKGMFYPNIRQEDIGTLDAIYSDCNDALCSTKSDWKSIYKSLVNSLGNKEFQHRARTMNVHCNARSFRVKAKKSRTSSIKFHSLP